MAVAAGKSAATLGFLTVVEHAQHGLMGGYLLLERGWPTGGIPLHGPGEAQSSSANPLRPDTGALSLRRADRRALVNKSTANPLVVCTDVRPVLAVRELITVPVALVLSADSDDDAVGTSPPAANLPRRCCARIGQSELVHRRSKSAGDCLGTRNRPTPANSSGWRRGRPVRPGRAVRTNPRSDRRGRTRQRSASRVNCVALASSASAGVRVDVTAPLHHWQTSLASGTRQTMQPPMSEIPQVDARPLVELATIASRGRALAGGFAMGFCDCVAH